MTSKEFDKLINKDKYQVFLCASRPTFPLTFAFHLWFVVNRKGVITRWEILHLKNYNKTSWNHLHMNFIPPWQGLWVIRFADKFKSTSKFTHPAKLLAKIEGEENSFAERMCDFIENSPTTYPYSNKYHYVGPNSNTYVQWVLNQFPEFGVKLPWNCFGKSYKIMPKNNS